MIKRVVSTITLGVLVAGAAIFALNSVVAHTAVAAAENPKPASQFESPTRVASFADVIERVSPSVVTVTVSRPAQARPTSGLRQMPGQAPYSPFNDFFGRFFDFPAQPQVPDSGHVLGSGFFVNRDGYVVTNNHVIDGATDIAVILQDGSSLDASLVGRDPKTDLALLKVAVDKPVPALRFGDSNQARVGDWVLAIGNPFGLGGTATAGIISARGRDIQSGPYDDYLQIDAPINSGNSGGPILNADGDVIGVSTAIYSPNGGNVGIGFAIPASQAKDIIEELKVNHIVRRGWLGIQIQGMDDELAQSLGLDSSDGALVAAMTDGSPADKAGIQVGDVITHFADEDIDSPKSLSRAVADLDPGTTARIIVWRDGRQKTLKVAVGEMDEPINQLADATSRSGAESLGLTLAPLSDAYRARIGAPDEVNGVVVESVMPGSAAADKGIRAGDLITSVNGHDVTTPGAIAKQLDSARADDKSLRLLVRRGDSQYFVALAPSQS